MRKKLWIALFFLMPLGGYTIAAEPKPAVWGIVLEDSQPPQPPGAVIKRVAPKSNAEAAGLRVDDVVFAVDGAPITNARECIDARSKKKLGEKCAVSIWRQGQQSVVTVTLGPDRPEYSLVQFDPPRNDGGTIVFSGGGGTGEGDIDSGGNYIIELTAGDGPSTRKGNFVQRDSGLMSPEIEGFPQHAIIHYSGDVTLAGILHVAFTKYTPKRGDILELISDARSLNGKFELLMLPDLPEGLRWDLVYDDLARGVDFDKDGKNDVTLVVKPSVEKSGEK